MRAKAKPLLLVMAALWSLCFAFDLTAADQSDDFAIPLDTLRPVYPINALVKRISAKVYLRVKLSPEGKPEQTQLDFCTRTWEGFEKAAKDAVMNARFEPPSNTGRRKVSKWRRLIVTFDPYADPNLSDTLPDFNEQVACDTPAAPTKPIRIGLLNDGSTNIPVDTGFIRVLVDRNGFPRKTAITRPGSTAKVDSLAVLLAREQQFTPAMLQGQPVATWIELPFTCSKPVFHNAVPAFSAIALPRQDLLMPLIYPPYVSIALGALADNQLAPVRPYEQDLALPQFTFLQSALGRIHFAAPPDLPPSDTLPLLHHAMLIQTQLKEIDWSSLPRYMGSQSTLDTTVLVAPTLLYSANANYADQARMYGAQATVDIAVLIDTGGSVRIALMTKASISDFLNKRILEAAIMNRYTPVQQNGNPIPVWYAYTVELGT